MSNGMFDRFKDSDGIDGSSVYALGTGYCESPVGEEDTVGAATAGNTTLGVNPQTAFEQSAVIPANATVTEFSIYSSNTINSLQFGIAKVNGSNYDLVSMGSTVNKTQTGAQTFSGYSYAPGVACYPAVYIPTSMNSVLQTSGSGQSHVGYTYGNKFDLTDQQFTDQTPSMLRISATYTVPGQNMVLISDPVTALAITSKAIVSILIKNIHTSTKVYVSSASSPSWTELTGLVKVSSNVGGSGIDHYATDLLVYSGSADKSMRWKVETDTGHSTQCYGVALNWV
jgi:hypothetical protein